MTKINVQMRDNIMTKIKFSNDRKYYSNILFWSLYCLSYEHFILVIIMLLDLQLPMQSVSMTTDVVSSNLAQGEVCNIMRETGKYTPSKIP
jgi:hypothetical protein